MHISPVAWNVFCNQVDEVLKPLESIKRSTQIVLGLGYAIYFLFEVICFSYLASVMGAIKGLPFPIFIVYVVGLVFLNIGMLCNHARTQAQVKKMLSELERVCGDTSNKFSSLSVSRGI